MATPVAQPALKRPQEQSLALVPGAGAGGMRRIESLHGGSVNDLWRVETSAGSFLLREDGPAWRRPGVDREREVIAHGLAAEAGIAPRILARSHSGDVMVTEFINGRVWTATDFESPAQREQLSALLGRVHRLSLPIASRWPFQPLHFAADYRRRAVPGARADAFFEAAQQACARLEAASAPRVLAHGDALPGNVIESAGRLWLIDWEFAQCADPVWDLAAFAVWNPAAVADLPRCAAIAGIGGDRLLYRLEAALALHRALGALWYLARHEEPPAALETGAGSGQTSAPL